MQQESKVPLKDRYLLIASKLSPTQVNELDTIKVPETIERCRERLDAKSWEAIRSYQCRPTDSNLVHLVVIGPYADLPLGKEYGVLFPLDRYVYDRSGSHEKTTAILRHTVIWGLPSYQVADGHHQICVVEFSSGIPALISSLGIEKDEGRSTAVLGMSTIETWNAIHGEQV